MAARSDSIVERPHESAVGRRAAQPAWEANNLRHRDILTAKATWAATGEPRAAASSRTGAAIAVSSELLTP